MEKVEQALNGKLYPNINTDVLKVGENRGQEGGSLGGCSTEDE